MTRTFLLIILILISFAFVSKQTFQLGKEPKKLPKIDIALTPLTWTRIVNEHLKYFIDDYSYESDSEGYKAYVITSRMFGSIYGWRLVDSNYVQHGLFQSSVYQTLVKPFYKSTSAQKALYQWVKPIYIDEYKKFPPWKKSIFKNMLIHAKKYISEFDYAAELKIYREFPNSLAYFGPKGYRGDYAKVEAFIFRRINNGDMTIKQMLEWIDILQKDIV
jgi:hypothetical protein